MDSFELNKIMGAVLATCLVLLVSSFTASAVFAPKKLEKPGYDIAVKEDDHAGGAKEAAAPAEPIEKLLQTASAEKGAAAMPDVFKASRTVMIAEKKVGDVYVFQEHWDEAERHYRHAAEIQQYSGIAPVTEASGQQHWVHWRWSCPKFLRQTFHEWAAQSILHSDWAEAYYRAQRDDKDKSHHAAVRPLAYKWLRIVFRCWKDRKPYDESIYETALMRHKMAPGPKPSSPFELNVTWTSCGSFHKIALKTAQKL